MKDLTVVSIQDGILLGLRFTYDVSLRINGIVGGEALEYPEVTVVLGYSESDVVIKLPKGARFVRDEIAREQAIHMLEDARWHSEQTGAFLLHQIRPKLRCNMVSPLSALAALQRNVGDGISYLSKQGEIFLNQSSIELQHANAVESRSGYLCGPGAVDYRGTSTSRILGFDEMRIELEPAFRSELQGLGHLFALTVGAAMHLVNSAAPHRPKNS